MVTKVKKVSDYATYRDYCEATARSNGYASYSDYQKIMRERKAITEGFESYNERVRYMRKRKSNPNLTVSDFRFDEREAKIRSLCKKDMEYSYVEKAVKYFDMSYYDAYFYKITKRYVNMYDLVSMYESISGVSTQKTMVALKGILNLFESRKPYLTDREVKIIEGYLNGVSQLKMSEEFGVTRERIRQVLTRAFVVKVMGCGNGYETKANLSGSYRNYIKDLNIGYNNLPKCLDNKATSYFYESIFNLSKDLYRGSQEYGVGIEESLVITTGSTDALKEKRVLCLNNTLVTVGSTNGGRSHRITVYLKQGNKAYTGYTYENGSLRFDDTVRDSNTLQRLDITKEFYEKFIGYVSNTVKLSYDYVIIRGDESISNYNAYASNLQALRVRNIGIGYATKNLRDGFKPCEKSVYDNKSNTNACRVVVVSLGL